MRRTFMLLASLAIPAAISAQTPAELLTQARGAFENLDFEGAARIYSRLLDVTSRATQSQRDTAQLYLAVSYAFADQRPNALSAFRSLIRNSPCATTPQEFGASVTALFIEARSEVFATSLCELSEQRLTAGDTARFRVAVTRPAMVRVSLRDSTGATVADLGEQAVDGITVVEWPVIPKPESFPTEPTSHVLVIEARERQGAATDSRSAPVIVYAPFPDTLPHPPPLSDTVFLPEKGPLGPALGDLGKGLLVGAGTAVIATTIAHSSLKGESGRALTIGGVISLVGVVGFLKGSSIELHENVEHNRQLRQQWLARRTEVTRENRARIAARQLVIAPGRESR